MPYTSPVVRQMARDILNARIDRRTKERGFKPSEVDINAVFIDDAKLNKGTLAAARVTIYDRATYAVLDSTLLEVSFALDETDLLHKGLAA